MKKGPRPAKPYAAFPLHAHACGQWSARINSRAEFFGVWADPKGALDRYVGTPPPHVQAGGPGVVPTRISGGPYSDSSGVL